VRSERARRALSLALCLAAISGGALEAGDCNVPTATYPTISSAVAAPACFVILVAAGHFEENVTVPRTVEIYGAGSAATFVRGFLRVEGATSVVGLADLAVDGTAPGVSGCWPSLLQVTQGARLLAPSVVVLASRTPSPCRIFSDGFELGTVNAWSSHAP